MSGGFGSPYRAPCGGWPAQPKLYLGGCYQHQNSTHSAITRYANTTTVPDYADPPGDDIVAYARPAVSVPSGCSTDPCGGTGQKFCGPWEEPVPENTWSASGTLDLSTCRKVGFKAVQAHKYWHGRNGFFYPETCTETLDAGCSSCEFEAEQGTPPQTRYLNKRVQISYTGVQEGEATSTSSPVTPVPYTLTTQYDFDQTISVGRLTGVMTQGATCTDNYSFTLDPEDTNAGTTGTVCTGTNYLAQNFSEADMRGLLTMDFVCGKFVVQDAESTVAFGWLHGLTVAEAETEFAAHCSGHTIDITVTDTLIDISMSGSRTDGDTDVSVSIDVTITLSGAYTAATLYSDTTTLLAEWDLTDDAKYPWRADSLCTRNPYVIRHEVPQAISPDSGIGLECGWSDPNADIYDGSILGSPLAAGYVDFFDFRFEDEAWCAGAGTWGTEWYGGRAPFGIPSNATRWTKNSLASDTFMPGAWLEFSGNALFAQKWAETKLQLPSHDFFRPCGFDRVMLDQSRVRCIDSISGTPSDVVLVTDGDPVDIATSDVCLVCGTGTDDGIWQVTKNTDDEYELTTFVADLPTGYDCTNTGTGGKFGKVRFPSAWAICGRVAVTNATNASPIVITLETAQPNLRTGDSVTISDVGGNTNANGTHVVTRNSDTEFQLNSTTGNGAFTASGWCKSASAPSYEWHDNQSKGDYALMQWTYDYRDYQERDRVIAQYATCNDCEEAAPASSDTIRENQVLWGMPQGVDGFSLTAGCVGFSGCRPSVMAISPNGESFATGTTHAFPASIVCDPRYGWRWQAEIRQYMTDPLWEAPYKSCEAYDESFGFGWSWLSDDGGCLEDSAGTTYYYPHAPLVEYRATVPSGAPALPSGIYIGCLSLASLDTVSEPSGNVCTPPIPPGRNGDEPARCVTPWDINIEQLQCVCGDGRFATEYEAQGVVCTMEVPPP